MRSRPTNAPTSRPSKAIVPAVGTSWRRISFKVVVFPHPDSPISPSVSPGGMAKSMPSTAFTHAPPRPSGPDRTGKCLVRSRASRTGEVTWRFHRLLVVQEPAPRAAAPGEVILPRLLLRAARSGIGTARLEVASSGQARQVGRLSGDRVEGILAPEL